MSISEKTVSLIWKYQLLTDLVTVEGERIEVIFPGREGNERGCDFSDAVFFCKGRTVYGNIEVHVKSSHWYGHGHHNDPNYNGIVLHVVMWHDCERPTKLQNGNIVPTLCLHNFISGPLPDEQKKYKTIKCIIPFSCNAAKRYSNSDMLMGKIELAGKERFRLKTDMLSRELLKGDEAGRVLLKHLARALGYISNVTPFERLAGLLILNGLESCPGEDILFVQSMILGTAGLLPSQRTCSNRVKSDYHESDMASMESIWCSLSRYYTMKEHEWCLYRVRPQNHPVRRQIALSLILERYRYSGLLNGLIEIFERSHIDALNQELLNGLKVNCKGYWADHADFGVPLKQKSALMGRGKAADIAVNVLLPFVASWAELHNDTLSRDKALIAYACFPRLEENYITRHMKAQVFQGCTVKMKACHQQGLIHIYRTYCRYRNCTECLISKG